MTKYEHNIPHHSLGAWLHRAMKASAIPDHVFDRLNQINSNHVQSLRQLEHRNLPVYDWRHCSFNFFQQNHNELLQQFKKDSYHMTLSSQYPGYHKWYKGNIKSGEDMLAFINRHIHAYHRQAYDIVLQEYEPTVWAGTIDTLSSHPAIEIVKGSKHALTHGRMIPERMNKDSFLNTFKYSTDDPLLRSSLWSILNTIRTGAGPEFEQGYFEFTLSRTQRQDVPKISMSGENLRLGFVYFEPPSAPISTPGVE